MAEGGARHSADIQQELPDGWEERYDSIHGRIFYVNRIRRVAQLEDPRLEGAETYQYGKDWINVIDNDAPLTEFPWFYGNILRKSVDRLLESQTDGTFLLRKSETFPGNYVISIRYNEQVKGVWHFRIVPTKQGYALDTAMNIPFDNLPKLVEHYTKHPPFEFGKLTAPLDKNHIEISEDESRRISQMQEPQSKGTVINQYDREYIADNDAPLEDFSWFYGDIGRIATETFLKTRPQGTFLIRKSRTFPGEFVISIRNVNHHGGIEHCRIIRAINGFAVMNDDNVSFDSLPMLVEHYTKHPPMTIEKLSAPLKKYNIGGEEGEADAMPEELENDPFTRQLYEKAIEEGTENDNTTRVMIIGCYGQGKTSLVRQLLKQPNEDVETTNGIEVQRCIMINETEWEERTNEDPEIESIQRLVNIARLDTDYTATSALSFKRDKSETEDYTKSFQKIDKESSNSILNEETVSQKVLEPSTPETTENTELKRSSSQRSSGLTVDSKNLKRFEDELKRHDSAEDKLNTGVAFNIWDFGGQFVYYATHQIFHSKQAIYVLVFNLNVGLDAVVKDDEFPLHTKTMRDYLRFWVDSVNSFVGSADGCEPSIILVGTHKDKLQEHVDVDNYFEEVRKLFDGSLCLNHIHPEHFAISNKDLSEKDITKLRKCIYNLGQKQVKMSVPAKWILLEKALKLEKAKKIINFEELMAIDKKNERPLQTNDIEETCSLIKLFLRYHHARGTFCYFDDDILSQNVVLDPQFLVHAFRCIITSEKFCKVRPRMRKQWDELCRTAILRAELLEEVWTQNENQDLLKFKDLLTEFLQKLRIISEVLTYNVCTKSFEPQGYYIVPSLLKTSADGAVIETFCSGKRMSEVSLGFVLENEILLSTLYQRCLAALVGKWPLVKFDGQFILYDDVIACELRHDHAGVLILTKDRLELVVVNLCPPDGVNPEVCDMFRRYVEVSINTDICKIRGLNEEKRLIQNRTIRCFHADHGSKGSKEIYILDELRFNAEEKRPCPDKGNHCLRLNSILCEWFRHEIETKEVPSRKLTSKEYSLLSMAIGRGWQQIGLQLGLNKVDIDHIEMNNRTVDMQIYAMFLLWDKKEADRATLDILVRAIKTCSKQVTTVNWDVLNNMINGF